MSNALWWVPFAAGFQDGVNPCILMVAALLLLVFLWFKRIGLGKPWILFLLSVIITSSFFINCGFIDKIILNKKFFQISKFIYVILALFVGFTGLKYLKQWFELVKNKEIKEQVFKKAKFSPVLLFLLMIFLGSFLSLLASLWPINYYISVFTVYMVLPGQLVSMGILILLYTFLNFWVVYLVVFFVSIESKNIRLFKIIGAAVLLSASLGVIDLFL